MASSDQVASIEPWSFRSGLTDSWLVDTLTRDNDKLTRALQQSLSSNADNNTLDQISAPSFLNDVFNNNFETTTPNNSGSHLSVSDPETPAPKRQRNSHLPFTPTGKVSKRKSRASKRSHTTFITADAANFRQMVQQVTGVRLGNAPPAHLAAPLLKPEPHRPDGRLSTAIAVPGGGGVGGGVALPTLETSSWMLAHGGHQEQMAGAISLAAAGTADGVVGGLGWEAIACFPTLESWKMENGLKLEY